MMDNVTGEHPKDIIREKKILVITQSVNPSDDMVGFFVDWLTTIEQKVVKLTIVSISYSDYKSLRVLSIYEKGRKGTNKILFARNLYRILIRFRKDYDTILFHMIPSWILLTAPLNLILRKNTILWYTHSSVNYQLVFAARLVDVICTASEESFRLKTTKKKIVGHGINLDKFTPIRSEINSVFRFLSISRLSPSKNIELMIEAYTEFWIKHHKKLADDYGLQLEFVIIGGYPPKSKTYKKYLIERISQIPVGGSLKLLGSKSYTEIPSILHQHHCFINLSDTNSLDKAVLESLATETPVITSSIAYRFLPNEMRTTKDVSKIVKKMEHWLFNYETEESINLLTSTRNAVIKYHNLDGLINNILRYG